MKTLKFLAAAAALCLSLTSYAGKVDFSIDKIEPPFWWAGMENTSLQLMVYGPGIAKADFSVRYPGVSVDSVVSLDSDDYLFVYLNIGKDTSPGKLNLEFSIDGKTKKIPYVLKKRDKDPQDYKGFDTSDVLYLIMPDRFAKGSNSAENAEKDLKYPAKIDRANPNARHGGDIAGLRQHLDYIDSLGVTAIWVNPVLKNDIHGGSYHGYATTDYYSIDPRFGSNDEWNAFVEEAHGKGIKVVMDMIFNHCGITHPWIENMPSKDWLNSTDEFRQSNFRLSTIYDPYASEYDRTRTVDGWFVFGMPDLNQRNPHLMKYLIQNSIWWIEESKIDGIRMDTHPYADLKAMASWIKTVEKEYPNFNIVGECWYGNEGGPAYWQKDSYINHGPNTELPTVMDFVLSRVADEAFNSPTEGENGLNKIYDHLALDFMFPNPSGILTFLDNHDTDRFLKEMPSDLDSWKQAQAFLLTSRGIPQIYYGTEILMNGTRENGGDGMIRLDMPGGFPGDTINVFSAEGRTPLQREAFDFLSKLLHFRKGNKVISEGTLKHFIPENGIYTYERRLGDDRVIVMMNGNDTPVTTEMKQTREIMPYGSELYDVLTGETLKITEEMTFPARALYILKDKK